MARSEMVGTSPRRPALAQRVAGLHLVGSRAVDREIEALRPERQILPLRAYPRVYPLPDHLLQAASRAMKHPIIPPSHGLPELREAIAQVVGGELGRGIDPASEVVVTSGGMHALFLVFSALLGPGDEVIVPTPSYFFDGLAELSGARIVPVPSVAEDGFAIGVGAIEEAISERTRAILVTSPNNPTGWLLSADDVRRLVDIAVQRGLWLVSDEAYDRLVFDGRAHASPGSVAAGVDHTVIVRSFTKSYALPTIRVGYVIAPRTVAAAIRALLEWTNLYGNDVVQSIAVAAMLGPQDWLTPAIREFQTRRDRAVTAISGAGRLRLTVPHGGPFAFVDVSSLGPDGRVATDLLRDHGVPVVPGSTLAGPGYIRMSIGGDEDVVEEALRRLTAYAEQDRPSGAPE